ncbi:SDR family oxidoreductase [Zooshikella marina]|uniref:SDR family oxidoreductase n=1 Tax=Zooshikella ganghwensis TaxID=202772 RepID=UPI00040E627D|nr:SDR family oxidoreductase [Zooshikella ganghwensis]MBU2705897.1 SDR family oxidoreductase [Zooshikella ganghwensis]
MHKLILITGASRGIGAATALLAASQGYSVIVNYKSQKDKAIHLTEQIRNCGGNAWTIQADISCPEQVIHMFNEIDSLGILKALVNNAGVVDLQTSFVDVKPERLQRIFNTNVIGAMLCAQQAIRRMSTRHGGTGGSIINVSSSSVITGSPNVYVDYAASKGALDVFTRGLAKEVAQEGIRVNAVRPGFISTDIHADTGNTERFNNADKIIPLGRCGNTEEIAEAILWLISEKASYCVGSFLNLTGGL